MNFDIDNSKFPSRPITTSASQGTSLDNNSITLTDIHSERYKKEVIEILSKYIEKIKYNKIISDISGKSNIQVLAKKYFIDVMNKLRDTENHFEMFLHHMQAAAYYLAMYSYDVVDDLLSGYLKNPLVKHSEEYIVSKSNNFFEINSLEHEDREARIHHIYNNWIENIYMPKLRQIIDIIITAFGKAASDRIRMGKASIKNSIIMAYIPTLKQLINDDSNSPSIGAHFSK